MEIRQATIDDSKFVALGIAMALHLLPDEETLQHIERFVSVKMYFTPSEMQ